MGHMDTGDGAGGHAVKLRVCLLLASVLPARSYGVAGWGTHQVAEGLTENVTEVVSNGHAFAALKTNGGVVTWGNDDFGGDSSLVASQLSSNVVAIFHNPSSFAAVKVGGEVVTWGHPSLGGDHSAVASKLVANVTTIFSNEHAFAALKTGGEVVTWGDSSSGGDSSAVTSKLSANVTHIFNNKYTFVALKTSGEVVTWGSYIYGGDSSAVSSELSADVTNIYPSEFAYAALKAGGEVVSWGVAEVGGRSSHLPSLRANVTAVFSKPYAFAALKHGGEVVTWGFEDWGGDSSAVAAELRANVTTVFSNQYSFVALKASGQVVTWGLPLWGASPPPDVAAELRADVTTIVCGDHAFAAIKKDGSALTWGHNINSSAINPRLSGNVTEVYAAGNVFAAIMVGGGVVTWGDDEYGGDSSEVASELRSGASFIVGNGNALAAVMDNGRVVTWGDVNNGGDSSAVAHQLQSRVKEIVTSPQDFIALICIPPVRGAEGADDTCERCPDSEVWQVSAVRCQRCSQGCYGSSEAALVPDSLQRECVMCSAGRAPDPDNTFCPPCTGTQYSKEGWSQCEECPNGHIPNAAKDTCHTCPPGTRATGAAHCEECPVLTWSDEGSNSCALDTPSVIILLCAVLVQMVAVYPLAWHLRRRRWVSDVTQLGDMVVVKTVRPHGMRGRPTKIRFAGTGDFRLDTPGKTFSARVLDPVRFELLTNKEGTILDGIESSMGTFRQAFPHDIINTGPLVPTAVFSCVLFPVPLLALVYIFGFVGDRPLAGPFLLSYVAATALTAVFAIFQRWRTSKELTPMDSRIIQYRERLLLDFPRPEKTETGPMRAVTMQQVLNLAFFFRDLIHHRTAYYLNSNIIMPVTKAHQLSFAELCGPSRLSYFVSHYWGTPFTHFVDSIQGHAEHVGGAGWSKLSYWICFLSNNQWAVSEELGGGSWKDSSFYKALRSGFTKATCMVLDADATPLSRLWCIFEVLQTYRMEHDNKYGDFAGLSFCTDRGVIGDVNKRGYDIGITLAEKFATLELENAHASNQDDELMIRELVEHEGGMQSMNEFVRGNMLTTLRRLNTNFNQETETVEDKLKPSSARVTPQPPKDFDDDEGQYCTHLV